MTGGLLRVAAAGGKLRVANLPPRKGCWAILFRKLHSVCVVFSMSIELRCSTSDEYREEMVSGL